MITIKNGSFQDSEGQAVANGSLTFRLNQDGVYNPDGVLSGQVTGGKSFNVSLNDSGNVPTSPAQHIMSNAEIVPDTTFYWVELFNNIGESVWQNAQKWTFDEVTGSVVDLDSV